MGPRGTVAKMLEQEPDQAGLLSMERDDLVGAPGGALSPGVGVVMVPGRAGRPDDNYQQPDV